MSRREQRNKERKCERTFHEMVVLGDLFGRTRAFDFGEYRVQQVGCEIVHVRLREPTRDVNICVERDRRPRTAAASPF